MIVVGDHVQVEGIQGVHTVVSVADVLDPSVPVVQVRLSPGSYHGRFRGGDLLAVPAGRCTRVGSVVPRGAATRGSCVGGSDGDPLVRPLLAALGN